MNIFLSYRYTGEDKNRLASFLTPIHELLERQGHRVFNSFALSDWFEKQHMTVDQIYSYCLEKQKACDTLFAFVRSEHPSKGMGLEHTLAKELGMRHILAIQEDLDFSDYRATANPIIEYSDESEIITKIEDIAL